MGAKSGRFQPRKNPSQHRARLTRDRILAAAAQVFASHGYAAGTTDRIAAAARISIGSLYQYFPNKDAVLLALSQAHLEAATDAIRAVLAEAGEDWLDGVIAAVIDGHAANPRLHKVLFDEAPRTPELLDRLRAAESAIAATIAERLRGDGRFDVEDPDEAADLVVATVESLTHHFVARDPDGFDAATTQQRISELLTRHLRPAPPPS
ncbi:TetR/AcrR family transcriptional regulator [Stackebrandtia nassauensis]|uniref:Transcriptional regulator, TetR family n=1 Tax=Stackebrandtia nassauensis (strain DSM 44728 / CIP 108903 / NRRL B-16338 / NBRC 102104 / LLR-40K-21) TaxID=446470 RepID=D3Q822_STANL|nr:TetR/AcrR family transcriptional regulator [Stackebrandtia nassauensis]ADD40527.1 transcriptional regulator, TetR family [Stackebrandtia nassauensis DSM 44728]